ncbi:YqaA family protein [Rhodovulum marinum]|uniref:Membrane protein YqaA with SNARE-associated domain n=1 Tax=Rhodovulum marinum TaxID=320662 RepID=A0A4R2PX31_9RHOB|nr:YqaA family protein [Rhodovulum marinum]TCP40549.1 membrane protein YqaA with SNARE-associated domain [Rhodovulum marinum]
MPGSTILLQLATLFAAAFGAATVLPFQSEVVFVALQLAGDIAPVWLVLVASVGNVLGAVVNYVLGRWVEHFRGRRWFPVSTRQLARAQHWYARWGVWTLLLSWAPLGDAFTVVAGMMRTPAWLFLLLVTLAKTGRYAVLAWATAAAAG